MLHKCLQSLLFTIVLMTVSAVHANEKEQQAIVDQQTKLETLRIVKDAAQLVEDIGFPENARLKIYLSHGPGKYFGLRKITVVIDGADRAEFDYSEKQLQALLRGGSNRIYLGAVTEGYHELVAVFEGEDRKGNIIKKAETWLFDKKPGETIVVLKVADNEATLRPDFSYKVIKGEQ